jgi:uncharacterized protein YndB with AHSA1/START domain
MKELSTSHHTIVVRRLVGAARSRVFAAWSNASELARWYVPGDATWSSSVDSHDFRVGGTKHITFGPRGGETFTEDCRYEDIVTDRRLCFSMTIARAGRRISTSMVTVELMDRTGQTELVVTDQLVILDGGEGSHERERGWGETLDKLVDVVRR